MKTRSLVAFLLIHSYGLVYTQTLEEQVANHINIVVAHNGSGSTSTIQEAINLVPDGNTEHTVIFIRKGKYKEKIIVPPSPH
ncbi:MAG: pectinesterase family protein [Bacteroidales bacterium]|nr:pectinesterase family protein [Bacteroidales bacterium]MDZ4203811.1 pectinesterase family protein [Bacteroidales bacterium]